MPRKAPRKRTQSGDLAQPAEHVAGQIYGKGVEQMALQKAMPTPNLRPEMPTVPSSPITQGGEMTMGADDVVARAAALRDQAGVLTRPSARPDEPITAGLTRGPGPGPEVLGMRRGNPGAEQLRRLSEATGDSYFADLARRAGM